MKKLSEITEPKEAWEAFQRAVRNLDSIIVEEIKQFPQPTPGDGPLVAHAKGAYQLYSRLSNGIEYPAGPLGMMRHPTQVPQ